nr:MAG TPA: hypothetical protein [Inoviridae sp.]
MRFPETVKIPFCPVFTRVSTFFYCISRPPIRGRWSREAD